LVFLTAAADVSIDLIDASKYLAAKEAYKTSITSNWAMREIMESCKKLECLADVTNLMSEPATMGEASASVRHMVVAPDAFAI
jgi:hypothetical protein